VLKVTPELRDQAKFELRRGEQAHSRAVRSADQCAHSAGSLEAAPRRIDSWMCGSDNGDVQCPRSGGRAFCMGSAGPGGCRDSPYLKASVTVGLFCDKAVPALVPPLLVDQCGRRCVLRPAGWSPLEYFEDLMSSLVGLEHRERRRSMGTQR
jgi:hypothetical protein